MATGAARETCETCGATLHAESPAGLCPACLLTTAIEEGDLEESISGSRIQDYELLNEIARGGMGIVYRARQRVPSRVVALKMILPAHVGSADAMKRFRAETEAAASLEHEGILPIYAVGEHDGAPFYSMKFAEGGTLADRLGQYRDKPREAAALVAALTRAVAYAHERGILHRDLKPGNVLFDGAGKPYVSDFGLAKWLARESNLTETFGVLGTPFYMAPEQAMSSHMVTASADVYSLGAILYHLLTGHPPFTGDTPMEVLRRAAEEAVPRPRLTNRSIPPDLETICLKCLEKEPAWRYPAAAALADELDRFCAGRAIHARHAGPLTRSGKWVRRNPTGALLVASLVALATAAGWIVWKSDFIRHPLTAGIAVLPFENLSEQKEDSAFADGVQDDILTKLAKIADLKVISRTSVMDYRGKRNLRQIGNDLRVTHVLEGSVRRTGTHFRLNAQLIDAQTDTHVWVEQYDRDLNDLFSIQAEIAQKVAAQLHAKIAPAEKLAIERKPTNNSTAYDAYLRGRAFTGGSALDRSTLEDAALRSYQEAVKLDPNFALAWAYLSFEQSRSYWMGRIDQSPVQLAAAKDSLDHALALDPNLPETHLALGYYHYYGEGDFTAALAEFQQAEQGRPNGVDAILAIALSQRRLGHWDEAINGFRRAIELDPRNVDCSHTLAVTYICLRRFPEAVATADHVLVFEPTNRGALSVKVWALWATGDLKSAEPLLTNPGADPFMRGTQALVQRRYAAAIEILSSALGPETKPDVRNDSEKLLLGLSQQRAGDVAAARATYQSAARDFQRNLEKVAPGSFAEAGLRASLGEAYAGLGEAASAVAEGQKAMAVHPSSKDPFQGPDLEETMARIYALLGDADHAIPMLKRLLQTPYSFPITPVLLRIDPVWDQIRNDPRFQELVAENKP